jgi:bisphosphoglycerate-dependent phosphoglycerate mutase
VYDEEWSCHVELLGLMGRRLSSRYYPGIEVQEQKNVAKKYQTEKLHNQEKSIMAKPNFRNESLTARQNSSA